MKLIVHLPAAQCESEDARSLPRAVANNFDNRALQARVDLRRLSGRGVFSLVIGLAFLIGCLWLRRLLATATGYEVLAEGLLIIGWVGLWRPVEIFLYDWWPIRRQQLRFAAIARMPILVVPEEG